MGLEGSYEWEMQVKPSGGNTHSRVEIFCADSVENNSKTEGKKGKKLSKESYKKGQVYYNALVLDAFQNNLI